MSDRGLVAVAVLAGVLALVAPAVPVALATVLLVVAAVTRRPVAVGIAVALVVGARAHQALDALDRPLPTSVRGTAELVGDPRPGRYGTQVEVRIAGRRWLADVDRTREWVLRPLLTGDHVRLTAAARPLTGAPEPWVRSRHLAGRLDVRTVGRGPPAAPWLRLANRVHRSLADGSESFGPERQSLFLGLVLGDDRAQSDLERFRFRATGLGHLLAVSGQNVAFLLAVAAPLLERCGPRARWVLGLVVLLVFVLVTRAEASVLRAAAMAGVALTAVALGRVASGARVLGLAVVALLLVDPLLVWSVGFQLSVCASAGLLVGVRPLARRLPGPRWVAEPVATTVAAQVATMPLLVPLAGGIPSVATLANVLAVPAAGLVMALGMSAGLVAGWVVPPAAAVVNVPARLLVAWVEAVARVGSATPLPLLGPDRLVLLGAGVVAVVLGRRRLPLATVLLAGALVAVALWPAAPGAGRYRPAPGVVLEVAPCGSRTVSMAAAGPGGDALGVLPGLQRLGVVRADVVTAGRGAAADAAQVAEQLGARLVVPASAGRSC